jgi:single-strand DNA-binding protein
MGLAKVVGIFRLVQDVELRYTAEGTAIASLNLVNSEVYKEKETTCYIKASAFGKSAEALNQYTKKGSKLYIVGKLTLQQWTDNNGSKKQAHSINIESFEFLDCKKGGQSNQPTQQAKQQPQVTNDLDISDEIPF